MNENLKYGLFFLGGVALGAVGAVAVSRGRLDLKPFATELISRGMDMKDAVLARVDGVKEDVEDMVAEARPAAYERKHHPPCGAVALIVQPPPPRSHPGGHVCTGGAFRGYSVCS